MSLQGDPDIYIMFQDTLYATAALRSHCRRPSIRNCALLCPPKRSFKNRNGRENLHDRPSSGSFFNEVANLRFFFVFGASFYTELSLLTVKNKVNVWFKIVFVAFSIVVRLPLH